MRKKIREAPHLVFKDEHGRFVAQKDRYRKARTAFVVAAKKMPGGIKKGGLIPLLEDRGRPITPSRLSEGAARMLSKQKALQAVEAIDPQPVEGVRAVGAHPLQELVWGVAPQVAPLWTSFGLYRFESNARSATILGLIGAGGIGQRLFEILGAFDYGQTATIILVIVIAVSLIDLLSQTIRTRLL